MHMHIHKPKSCFIYSVRHSEIDFNLHCIAFKYENEFSMASKLNLKLYFAFVWTPKPSPIYATVFGYECSIAMSISFQVLEVKITLNSSSPIRYSLSDDQWLNESKSFQQCSLSRLFNQRSYRHSNMNENTRIETQNIA